MNQKQFKNLVIKNDLFIWDYSSPEGTKNLNEYDPNEDDKSKVSGLKLTQLDIDENMKHYKETSNYLFDNKGGLLSRALSRTKANVLYILGYDSNPSKPLKDWDEVEILTYFQKNYIKMGPVHIGYEIKVYNKSCDETQNEDMKIKVKGGL